MARLSSRSSPLGGAPPGTARLAGVRSASARARSTARSTGPSTSATASSATSTFPEFGVACACDDVADFAAPRGTLAHSHEEARQASAILRQSAGSVARDPCTSTDDGSPTPHAITAASKSVCDRRPAPSVVDPRPCATAKMRAATSREAPSSAAAAAVSIDAIRDECLAATRVSTSGTMTVPARRRRAPNATGVRG